jgi:sugar phosphate permease
VIVAGFCIVGIASLLLLPVSEAHPAALTITMIGAFCGIGAMLSAAATLALEALPRNAGMASGIMGSFQILLGAVFSLALAFVDANSLLLLHLSTAGCAGLMGITILATRRLAPLGNR